MGAHPILDKRSVYFLLFFNSNLAVIHIHDNVHTSWTTVWLVLDLGEYNLKIYVAEYSPQSRTPGSVGARHRTGT